MTHNTKFVLHYYRAMKNLTISLDETVARWVRIKAAEADLSMSRYVSELLQTQMAQATEYERAMRRHLSRQPKDISGGSAYPGREEIHDRALFR